MNLKNKFSTYKTDELVEIAELYSDYTIEAKKIAIQILEEKKIEDLIENVEKYWMNYLKENIKSILINKEIPKSQFLNKEEVKTLIKESFLKWKEDQELYEIDTTKYWAVF